MRQSQFITVFVILAVCFGSAVSTVYAGGGKGKIPLTTSSKKALKSYLQGRELAEKLRLQESRQFFQNAVNEDPNFAMAHLNLSQVQPTNKEFFASFNKSVALVDRVSDGERLWILGFEAAVNGDPAKQGEYYRKLVKAYPDDERGHNLLGGFYYGIQEYKKALKELERAIKINPEFSAPYNMVGYSHRFLGDYDKAEKAFKKYIELIPDDPNPYDSYAELLMKMGRYDASIDNYEKALEINNSFVFSFLGIASNLNCKGDHKTARKQLKKMYSIAETDGQRRTALTAMAISFIDEGKMEEALGYLRKQYKLAEAINDTSAMSGDLTLIGNVLLEAGKPDKAMAEYDRALEMVEKSSLSQETKNLNKLVYLYSAAQVDLARGYYKSARLKSAEYSKKAEAKKNVFQIRLSHQLAGMIALKEGDYKKALKELEQANLQDPYNVYRMARAFEGKGNKVKAKEYYKTAANFNVVNNISYAYIRADAVKKYSSM